MLPADTFKTGKHILTLYLAKLRYKTEDILETHELFIYEDIQGPGGNVPDFGRLFLKLKYADLNKNTYIRS